MTSLFEYLSSWFISKESKKLSIDDCYNVTESDLKESEQIMSTAARNMPPLPPQMSVSQISGFNRIHSEEILSARSRLKHREPEPRRTVFPPRNPLLIELSNRVQVVM